MQNYISLDSADAYLAEIGGEQLAGSCFENEPPETEFCADLTEVTTPQGRS
jgi:hypothetical protein